MPFREMHRRLGADPTDRDPRSGTGRVAVGSYGGRGRRSMALTLGVAANASAFESIAGIAVLRRQCIQLCESCSAIMCTAGNYGDSALNKAAASILCFFRPMGRCD